MPEAKKMFVAFPAIKKYSSLKWKTFLYDDRKTDREASSSMPFEILVPHLPQGKDGSGPKDY